MYILFFPIRLILSSTRLNIQGKRGEKTLEYKFVDRLTSFGTFFTKPQAKRSTWKRFSFVGLDQQADTEGGYSTRIARAR